MRIFYVLLTLAISLTLTVLLPTYGGALNEYVMAENGNKMPVHTISRDKMQDDGRHVLMDHDTKDKILADWIPFPHSETAIWILSPGDILIYSWYVTGWLSIICLIYLTIRLAMWVIRCII